MALCAGCGNSSQEKETAIITVDVHADYLEKKLMLQDFLEVEYIPLETNDEFITQGHVMAIGDRYVLAKNRTADGDIFLFDRQTGKGIRKINRKGQGAEEYTSIYRIVLDEANEEMFVNCMPMRKTFVYDLEGRFKRSFNHADSASYSDLFNYDREHLIGYDMSIYYKEGMPSDGRSYHVLISKQDGIVTWNIPIPFDIVKVPFVHKENSVVITHIPTIVPWHDKFLLIETSTDTVYLSEGNTLRPFLVKTASADPQILLTMGTMTDRYYFLQTIKKEFDFTTGKGFPRTDLMYDTEEKALYRATVFNADYEKHEVNMNSNPVNGTIAAFDILTTDQLVEAYEKDELKGPLKDIAAQLDEEANPVLVVMKYKTKK
ncbi:6-bladed beta-propeller [Tannerella sp.]|uniref:6-bladed beta-propeller n=1 Tax=Tannerella sp. TaxID=2382127 RepID=UPI0026DC5A39|nr:6-bladed beta-propeller [Tannerella sp.]MDO4702750.1 6-bladed beta-propeller [Tannerella sp.]